MQSTQHFQTLMIDALGPATPMKLFAYVIFEAIFTYTDCTLQFIII